MLEMIGCESETVKMECQSRCCQEAKNNPFEFWWIDNCIIDQYNSTIETITIRIIALQHYRHY